MKTISDYSYFKVLDEKGDKVAVYLEWRYAEARLATLPAGRIDGYLDCGEMGLWEFIMEKKPE